MADFKPSMLPFHQQQQDRYPLMNSNHHPQACHGTSVVHLAKTSQEDLLEDRVRVDRKLYERLVDGNQDGVNDAGDSSASGGMEHAASSDLLMHVSVPSSLSSGISSLQPGNAQRFFHEIEKATGVSIAWPPKVRVTSRSRKDPQISIYGSAEAIKQARSMILVHLDTRKNRVTLKMDIAFTDHSHIIGKGGRSIQKVMDETGCHIHFPDSNRTSTYDKSNQVSIAGTAPNAEQARLRVRELLPVTVSYEIPFSSYLRNAMDQSNTSLSNIQRTYGVNVSFRPISTPTYSSLSGFEMPSHAMVLVIIRGSKALIQSFRTAVGVILAELTGGTFRIESTPAIMETEIAAQHHSLVMGRNSANIQLIMKNHNSVITFPNQVTPPSNGLSMHETTSGGSASMYMQKRTTVTIKGTNFDSAYNSWLDLLGYLPLVLIFDLPEARETDAGSIAELMDQFKVSVLIKPKAKQNNKSVMVRGCERESHNLYHVRNVILDMKAEGAPCCEASNTRSFSNSNNFSNVFFNQHLASPVPNFFNSMPLAQGRALTNGSMAIGPCVTRPISHSSLVTCHGSTTSTPLNNERSLSWNSSSPDDVFGPDSRTRARLANGHTPVRCQGKSKSESLPFRSDGSLSFYNDTDETRRSTILPATSRETVSFLNTLELLFNRNPLYLPQTAVDRVAQSNRLSLHNQQVQQIQPTQQSPLPSSPAMTQVASPVSHTAAGSVQLLQQREQQQQLHLQQLSKSPNVPLADFNDARENDELMDTVSLSQLLTHYSLGRYCDLFEDVNLRQFLNLTDQDLRRRALSHGARENIRGFISQLRHALNLDDVTAASRAILQTSTGTNEAIRLPSNRNNDYASSEVKFDIF